MDRLPPSPGAARPEHGHPS